MFEYFPNNYTWSLAVMSALNRGGQIAEIDEACRSLKEAAGIKALGGDVVAQNAWFESWTKMAERVERLAQADEQAGNLLSAGRKYLRCGLYFQLAERMPSHKDPRRVVAYKKGIAAYERGLKFRKEPVEYVQVPYEGTTLPAIFMKAPGAEKAPCMVHFNGLDLTKEIVYSAIADEFKRRGVSVLIVDHPGVGAALRLQNLPSGPDTERSASACVDYLETRSDVDMNNIGIIALSLGGYYAPRAAAFEPRFKCCVAWGAIFDYGHAVESRLKGNGEPSVPGYAEHVNWVFGTDSFAETLKIVKQMTLEPIAHQIRCSLLVVHGENDRQIPLWHAEKTIEAAVNSPDKELKVFSLFDGGAEHCGADNSTMVVDYMTDWVARRLGGNPQGI
jgi:dipeptidyl aminopeptidase/acylaminoacyl peptidase